MNSSLHEGHFLLYHYRIWSMCVVVNTKQPYWPHIRYMMQYGRKTENGENKMIQPERVARINSVKYFPEME